MKNDCSLFVVQVGSLREKMTSHPPPKVIEFVEPGKQRREKKAVWPPVRAEVYYMKIKINCSKTTFNKL